jgi:sporulation-control protein spo0M
MYFDRLWRKEIVALCNRQRRRLLFFIDCLARGERGGLQGVFERIKQI